MNINNPPKFIAEDKSAKYANLFLDTCALFKLLANELNEPGTEILQSYLSRQPGIRIHTSEYCIGEVFGVLKRKWFRDGVLSVDGYLLLINRIRYKIDNKRLVLHDLSLSKYFGESSEIVKKYDVDFLDALFLNHCRFEFASKGIFVTADEKLSQAANDFGVLCWNVLKDSNPP
ncbi:MAG: type II toxin-antitoxin system VapC family toxin [Thermodesulfobacteriota bacterium]|nr:MAG: type II toxin-antitoxin system VapC family toxin [Thermodesulfobacteriota bacterium]